MQTLQGAIAIHRHNNEKNKYRRTIPLLVGYQYEILIILDYLNPQAHLRLLRLLAMRPISKFYCDNEAQYRDLAKFGSELEQNWILLANSLIKWPVITVSH